MISIPRPYRLIAAFAFVLSAFAQAAPIPDTTFGTNGSVRIGVPSGNEDTAYTSAMQADGKVVVAGTSIGRQANAFVTRFETGGAADTAFGTNGTVLLSPPAGYSWMTPIQLEAHADGSLLMVGILYNGFVLARIGAGGELDSGFGSGGMLVVHDTDAFHGNADAGAIRVATQPDGRILVVTDASANGIFALRFRRFLAQGTPDTSFGANGERLLGNLPPDFAFGTSSLAVAEPAGGFTLAARASFQGGTYLLLRVTGDGALDTGFGSVGFVSGYDLGNPRDAPTQLARTATNRYVLIGTALTDSGNPTGYDAVWKVEPDGRPVAAFANNGRLLLADTGTGPGLVEPLPDEGVAMVQNAEDANVRVSRFDASGNPATQFGSGGSMTIAVADRQDFLPVGIHADAGGQLTVAGWGNTSTIFSGTMPIRRGNDVLLAGLTSGGQLRTDFGGGDGITVWNNPAYSNDRIDALRFDAAGRIVLIGYSGDYLLSRLTAGGALDATYGIGGRLSPQLSVRFTGPARAAQQPDDAIVVASGEALGSFGTVRSVTAFRATPNGTLDGTFQPHFLAAGANAAVALGVRPDGRLVYGTSEPPTSYVLQQFLPDGNPDVAFGTNGRVVFPATVTESAIQADLVVLGDGAIVFAVFSPQDIRLYKVDANGAPVQAFGAGGLLVYPYPVEEISINFPIGPKLLALADGTLLAATSATGVSPTSPLEPQRSLFALRVSANGAVMSASNLLPDPGFQTWALAALPDSSVLIARNRSNGTATLYRLLPDNQFDAAFGIGGAYALPGFSSATAMALDMNGQLVVAGVDPASALVARYRLDAAAVAGVAVVEYFNVDLRHYFITASPAEMASIESGGAGPGWQRTGYGFHAYVPEVGVPVGARPVCRFYGTPGSGPNSHFYTADADECAAVKRDSGWRYEGIAFYVTLPNAGQCASAAPPVFRAYNNRYAQNDSNHRYATDYAQLQGLQPQGWSIEGLVFCAAPG